MVELTPNEQTALKRYVEVMREAVAASSTEEAHNIVETRCNYLHEEVDPGRINVVFMARLARHLRGAGILGTSAERQFVYDVAGLPLASEIRKLLRPLADKLYPRTTQVEEKENGSS